ncbi:lipase family protein, partial [Myxococcota bacterium]|nr:lipase family protein [Myxococcota bacterium]
CILRKLKPVIRGQLLALLDPVVRDQTLGANAIKDAHKPLKGPAADYDWKRFEHSSKTYTSNNAWGLALAAKKAYEPFPENRLELQEDSGFADFSKAGYEVRFLGRGEGSTQAFIAIQNKNIIIAFRGTEPTSLEDIATDAKFLPAGGVHPGFAQALNEVWPDLEENIRAAQKRKSKKDKNNKQKLNIHITGHSLGAALATLAAIRLEEELGLEINGLYTFGSPRVMDSDEARHFATSTLAKRTWRLINNTDLVTEVPPKDNIFNYSHVGTPLYFDRNGVLRVAPGNAFIIKDRKAALLDDALVAKLRARDLEVEAIWDHSAKAYVKHAFISRQVHVGPSRTQASLIESLIYTSILSFDWMVTDKEAKQAIELLQGLDPESQRQVLDFLSKDTIESLLCNIPDEAAKAVPDLMSELKKRLIFK